MAAWGQVVAELGHRAGRVGLHPQLQGGRGLGLAAQHEARLFYFARSVDRIFAGLKREGGRGVGYAHGGAGEVVIPGYRPFWNSGFTCTGLHIEVAHDSYLQTGVSGGGVALREVDSFSRTAQALGIGKRRFEHRFLHFQTNQVTVYLVELLAGRHLLVVPQNRLVAHPAVLVNADIVAQFSELPHHFRARHGKEEGRGHFPGGPGPWSGFSPNTYPRCCRRSGF